MGQPMAQQKKEKRLLLEAGICLFMEKYNNKQIYYQCLNIIHSDYVKSLKLFTMNS
jgi:hypothetical protein